MIRLALLLMAVVAWLAAALLALGSAYYLIWRVLAQQNRGTE